MFEKRLSEDLPDIQSNLLSGMLLALRKLSTEIKIGEFSTFNTQNKKVCSSVTKSTIISLIFDLEDTEQEYEKLAIQIGEMFEKSYDIKNWDGNTDYFFSFHKPLESLLKDFEWKQIGSRKSLKNPFIYGFILYQTNNKVFYDYTSEKYDPIKLIKEAETRKEKKVRIDEKSQIYYFIKNESTGGIIIFDPRIPNERLNRLSKTFSFLIEHLTSSYSFRRNLLKSAQKIYSQEIIEAIITNANKPLLEIFNNSDDALDLIENIRKFKVRVLVNF